MRAPRCIRLALIAAATTIVGSSLAAQQVPTIDPSDPFRCIASSGYANQVEMGVRPSWAMASGTLVFHAAHPDCECHRATVSLLFTSASADPDKDHGNGLYAEIREEDPTHVHLWLMIDGEPQAFGDYDYGQPIPFKVAFDDAKGTMTMASGKFAATAKPAHLRRSTIYIPCLSADVSVVDLVLKDAAQ